MIDPTHILALCQPGFVRQQVRTVFWGRSHCVGGRESVRRGWGFRKP